MGDSLSHLEAQALISRGVAGGYLNTDLNARFFQNRAATYLPLASDDGIKGIPAGDTFIDNRSIKPKPGRVSRDRQSVLFEASVKWRSNSITCG